MFKGRQFKTIHTRNGLNINLHPGGVTRVYFNMQWVLRKKKFIIEYLWMRCSSDAVKLSKYVRVFFVLIKFHNLQLVIPLFARLTVSYQRAFYCTRCWILAVEPTEVWLELLQSRSPGRSATGLFCLFFMDANHTWKKRGVSIQF